MEPEVQAEENIEPRVCPECGAEESGHFCRACGALLWGDDMVLCPRCHHVVPDGEFCNLCGQGLGGIALNLRQLALAGGDFWVTALSPPPAAPESAEQSLVEPDESLQLDKAELPDWLEELSVEAPPEAQAHTYPSLQPIAEGEGESRRGHAMAWIFVLLALLLVSLVAGVAYLLVRGIL
jgi:hypothetical protein